jgi:ureidoacrylate peracid hydrolase
MTSLHNRREVGTLVLGGLIASNIAPTPSRAAARQSRLIALEARPEAITFGAASTAMLVIDMQNDFAAKGGMFERAGIDVSGIQAVLPAVKAAIASARATGIPVIYLKMGFKPDLSDAGPAAGPNLIKHAPLKVGSVVTAPNGRPSRILIRDTWNTDIVTALTPQPGDTVLYKTRFSGFFRTRLDEVLRGRGIETLLVTGCTTSICVESTVRDAMFRDYRCVVLEDCAAEPIGSNEARTNHAASLLAMQMLFAWISDSQHLAQSLEMA